ncbi:MAG TPA: FAD-dependent oxidoreductase [Planctomycetota bacterium]|nr:FAD-dependent oxidoreductase [Planctomycetota bacterium]
MTSGPSLPRASRVVIVGGGIAGASIAYHLTLLGWTDVVLLEQGKLGGGTTWHAAGLVGRLRTTNSMTRINKYSVELYASLEAKTGHSVGWKEVGSLIVARSKDRMTQLRRTTAMAEMFGVEAHMIGPEEAREKWPLMRSDDLLGAAWLPHDGKVIPGEVPIALAKGAARSGARVIEGVRVLDVERRDGRARGVKTSAGVIEAECVVLAGGMWTRQLGLRSGVTIPLYPVEHHYVVSEPIDGAHDALPVGRDPDLCIYFRGEGNAVMLGAFQKHTKPWRVDPIPDDFSFRLLEPDWEKYAEPLAAGKWRIPALEKTRFAKFVNGPESFTPDNNFILGEAPELRGLYVAAGFNSVGIASAGGAGKCLAEWIVEGQPTMDVWSVDIRRFGPHLNNTAFLEERVTEVLGLHYQLAWPNREPETGRDLRRSPLHERLAARGASFGQKNGWERPNWFAGPGKKPAVEYSFGRQNWFENHAAEHRAAREAVAIFDQSGFSKLVMKGRDAAAVLQRLCGANTDVAVGRAVYTGLFNERGGFESDLTVIRLAQDEYRIVTGTTQAVRDLDWIARHVREDEHAEVVDVTTAYAVIGVMGPRSRELLSRVTRADLSAEAFPFGAARPIGIGPWTALAIRITYVGELGWELHVSVDQAGLVHDRLMAAGADLGARDAGHYAINSLRLEKGYRAWGADISPDDTPLEAGLSFAVAWDKPVEFIGREALLRQKAAGWRRQLVTFVLEDPAAVLWGSEPILRDGKAVGSTTSGSYGHTLGAAVALGYVESGERITPAFIRAGSYEIDIAGTRHAARAHLRAPHDPERKRILA